MGYYLCICSVLEYVVFDDLLGRMSSWTFCLDDSIRMGVDISREKVWFIQEVQETPRLRELWAEEL